jgi:predicted metal-dependent hydrolase
MSASSNYLKEKETHIIYKLKTIPNKQIENIIKDTATRIYISRLKSYGSCTTRTYISLQVSGNDDSFKTLITNT